MASNRGRNLTAIADRAPGGADLSVVLTNTDDAPVLSAAVDRAIPTETVFRRDSESRRDHEHRVLDALDDHEFDLVCLDGYMRILSDAFLERAPTTLNVHPSLLPAFPGTDAWGDALAAGVSVTGCTVHVVTDATDEDGAVIDSEIDSGPIVTQEPVPVYEDDSREQLKQRVLQEGESRAYPRAVRWFAEDRVSVDREAGTVAVAGDTGGRFPERRVVASEHSRDLRYGENPHQNAALYADPTDEPGVVTAPQLNEGAKGMSYNNYNDADAALALVREFADPAAAVIKHTNPAGCATADSLAGAYDRALSTDPMSAFGGIVALNRECDTSTAEAVVDSFKEVVLAPGYTDDALDVLFRKENLRVLDVGSFDRRPDHGGSPLVETGLTGGRLLQGRDDQRLTREDLEVVTEREPTDEQVEAMRFGWQTLKHVKSNGILFAKGTETVGVGMGQVSRVDAVRLAAMKADEHAEGKDADGAVMASDAFFPFPDGVEYAAEAGIEAVVQPGGSKNDDAVIEAADELGLAMVLTGQRAFRHD
ncbi:MAG: phosphoribosylglycinamide formyltransferase, formyltetrahydrofolate-dependent [halophilic archaeon J07HX64]|jgi:phosphoribosylglycinamide formyltransferase, formyltetrahydrofolate-dependent|nr:MAG: phosphoribosylglycinamide formyltransferase, formyltetrahydrofolate-dependent [halophilic archaeon J07HX64]